MGKNPFVSNCLANSFVPQYGFFPEYMGVSTLSFEEHPLPPRLMPGFLFGDIPLKIQSLSCLRDNHFCSLL